MLTNGNETQTANLQMDDIPGINVGAWYDFGGDWDQGRQRWTLFGSSLSDLEYHCHPVLRVGGAVNDTVRRPLVAASVALLPLPIAPAA